MRTLVVGDLHLLGSTVLPLVTAKLADLAVDQVVLLGDYFDQWSETENSNLYQRELAFLTDWVTALRGQGTPVVCLLGNHDVPYLTGSLSHYSNADPVFGRKISAGLFRLGCQLALKSDGYLLSHAGFVDNEAPESWYFASLSRGHLSDLNRLDHTIGFSRGGLARWGSLLWADFDTELSGYFNPDYPRQIVGHTPVTQLTRERADGTIIDVDTFSLFSNHRPIGNGDLLLLVDGHVQTIPTDFCEVLAAKQTHGDLFSPS
ncbi:metallophosphoesterase family protein [Lapidilactobacillus salsurivasis]